MSGSLLHQKIYLLNGGYLRYIDHMGDDLAVVRSARVSYDADWREPNKESDSKLINFLWKNGHVSPFEGVQFKFEVEAPILVLRQWMRHQQNFNEVSGRYTEIKDAFYVPQLAHIAKQSKSNKQGREATPLPVALALEAQALITSSQKRSFAEYRRLLDMGIARETARTVLPLGTFTRMFVSTTLRNWLFFLARRTESNAQLEIRVYAEEIKKIIGLICPITMEAFDNYQPRMVDMNMKLLAPAPKKAPTKEPKKASAKMLKKAPKKAPTKGYGS